MPDHSPDALGTQVSVPPAEQARVVGAYALTALEYAESVGVDRAALAQAAQLDAAALADASTQTGHLSVAQYVNLLEAAARLSGDACFGLHVGERVRLSSYPFYGLVVCACPTFRAAFEQTQRYEGLAHDLGRSRLVEQGGVATYAWDCPWLDRLPSRHLCESVLTGIVTFANWMANARLPIIEVGLPYAAPGADVQAEYQRIFGAPVRFEADVTYGCFDAALLDMPVRNNDASMFAVLQRRAEELLQERQRAVQSPPVVAQVRGQLAALLAQDRARLDDVAQALGITPRTLQRKLAEVGTTYQRVLDAVRRELAEQLLRDPQLNFTDVAFLLGYHEQSSFNRACREWFGTTPARQRERLLQAG
ncbi:AraC family transcriptional regulator ligand-binding domain-containing protein [Aquabacterium sp.]|uniref:AraC family transcriptional regulator ligand-binding domain-containing protein n=1 Tax=Aquabacterium sp. TaxID=1872578 RepID=UPI0035AE34A3